jgi:hypothetical protein
MTTQSWQAGQEIILSTPISLHCQNFRIKAGNAIPPIPRSKTRTLCLFSGQANIIWGQDQSTLTTEKMIKIKATPSPWYHSPLEAIRTVDFRSFNPRNWHYLSPWGRYWRENETETVRNLPNVVQHQNLLWFKDIRFEDINIVGGKAQI